MALFSEKVACPKCGVQIKSSAKFCFSCGASISAASNPSQQPSGDKLQDNHWSRQPDDFAVRIGDDDIKDIKGGLLNLTRPLVIEHGTRALIFAAGAYRGEVSEGRYDMNGDLSGLAKALNFFKTSQHVVAIIVDAGDVTVEQENPDFLTRDGFAVGAKTQIILQIADPDRMFVNLMKGKQRVSVGDLTEALSGELKMVLGSLIAARPVEELLTSATVMVRSEIESALQRTLAVTLERLGLSLVQVRFIDFTGEKYRQLVLKRGEANAATMARRDKLADDATRVDIEADRVKLSSRLREIFTDDKLNRLKFDDIVRQAEHDLGLKEVIRDDEMARLGERFTFERDREGVLRRIEVAGIQNDHAREQAWKDLEARERHGDETHRRDLQRQLAGAQGDLDKRRITVELDRLNHAERLRQSEEAARSESNIAKIKHEEKVRKVQSGLDHMKQLKTMEAEEDRLAVELEERKLKARKDVNTAALISVLGEGGTAKSRQTIVDQDGNVGVSHSSSTARGDGSAAEKILELEKFRIRSGLTAEQMLAMAADDKAAGAALASKYGAEATGKRLEEQQRTAEAHATRMADVMTTAMNKMGDVAEAKAKAGGPTPTFVTGAGQPNMAGSGNPAFALCKFCGAALNAAKPFCADCGKQQ